MLRVIILLALALPVFTAAADDTPINPSPGERWERALLDAKERGQLPGPRPGQRCLWSKRLGACLWYTPGLFDFTNRRRK